MSKFRIGSVVTPMWDKTRRGKVVQTEGEMATVKWFEELLTEQWHQSNLIFVSPKEEKVKTIRCKPVLIPNDLEIFTGNFTHVVVEKESGKIIAAFVDEHDAGNYIDGQYGTASDYTIREVE